MARTGEGLGMDLPTYVATRSAGLLRLAWLLTGDADRAQDAVQEALARVVPRWSSIARQDPEPYVRTVLRSVCIDAHRRRSVRPREEQLPDDAERLARDSRLASGSAGGPEAVAPRLDLAQALARLTPKQREVLVLRFYEDLTEAATARLLGCSVSTVKSQTRHALERLRVLAPDLLTGNDDAREGLVLRTVPQNGEVTS
jgi:RNA polymerase sigma-70 factor (sigma-E family)